MISVDPIRDEKKIQTMKTYLKGRNLRDHYGNLKSQQSHRHETLFRHSTRRY